MTNEQHNEKSSLVGRISTILFVLFFSLYILNVLIGKAKIVYGLEIFHFGNVSEFLILFSASIFFVISALIKESAVKRKLT